MTPEAQQILQVLSKQFSSGRFWLTIIAGAVFAYVSVTKIIDPKDVLMVIMVVFTGYFNKERPKPV
jgi:hypothetical protein